MHKENARKPGVLKASVWFLVELLIYSAFVVVYYFMVLHFLRDWLKHIFEVHKTVYAIIVLPLIIAQAALLHFVTMALRKWGGTESK